MICKRCKREIAEDELARALVEGGVSVGEDERPLRVEGGLTSTLADGDYVGRAETGPRP